MILMLKKLVIFGSLLGIGPMLAGCPGAFFLANTIATPIATGIIGAAFEIASTDIKTPDQGIPNMAPYRTKLKNKTAQELCTQLGSDFKIWPQKREVTNELEARGHLNACRKSILTRNANHSSSPRDYKSNREYSERYRSLHIDSLCRQMKNKNTPFFEDMQKELLRRGKNCSSDYREEANRTFANTSKSELCHLAKSGGAFKEKANAALRSRGLSCDDEQQRLAVAQKARDAQNQNSHKILENIPDIKKAYQLSESCGAIFMILTSGEKHNQGLGKHFTILSNIFSDISNYYFYAVHSEGRTRGQAGEVKSREMEKIGEDYDRFFTKKKVKKLIKKCIGWSVNILEVLKNKRSEKLKNELKVIDLPSPSHSKDYPEASYKQLSKYISQSFKNWENMGRITPNAAKNSLRKPTQSNDKRKTLDKMFLR